MYFSLKMNFTYKQREILLNYMESHRELLQGRLSRKSESRRTIVLLLMHNVLCQKYKYYIHIICNEFYVMNLQKDMWDDLANTLNGSAEGPKKIAEEWRKVKAQLKNCTLLIFSFLSFLSFFNYL